MSRLGYQRWKSSSLLLAFGLIAFSTASEAAAFIVRWKGPAAPTPATEKAWDQKGLAALKAAGGSEIAGLSGEERKNYRWALFSTLLEASLSSLPPDSKASVDLICLRASDGSERFVPRILVDRHKLLVGWSESRAGLVVRVSQKDKQRILSEGFAWPQLEGESFAEVDLGNSSEKFATVFLKQRTNPAALRGEKVFVQSCVGCHAGSENRGSHGIAGLVSVLKTLDGREPAAILSGDLLTKHSKLEGAPRLGDKEKRALVSYATKFREESGKPSQ